MKTRKIKPSSLVIGLAVGFLFSTFIGIIGISRGLGSIYPQLNKIAKPFVCPSQQMTYAQHITEIGSETYWSTTWFCAEIEIASNTISLYAGLFYGLILFVILLILVYVYWNSSIGPAKNDGLYLW